MKLNEEQQLVDVYLLTSLDGLFWKKINPLHFLSLERLIVDKKMAKQRKYADHDSCQKLRMNKIGRLF